MKNIKQLNNKDYYFDLLSKMAWSDYQPAENEALPAPAFVTGGNGREYKIYVTDVVPEAHDVLLIHEVGHMVFQHLRFSSLKSKQIAMNIKAHWDQLKECINIPDTMKPEDVAASTVHLIMNYAQDMQVNSRVYTADEKDYVNQMIGQVAYAQATPEQRAQFDAMNTSEPFAKGVFPDDYDFPNGLTWFEYIELILQNPAKFFNDFQDNQNPQNGNGESGDGEGQDGDGQSGEGQDGQEGDNESSKEGGDGKNNGKSGKGKANGGKMQKANAEDIMKAAGQADTSDEIEKKIESQEKSAAEKKAEEKAQEAAEEEALAEHAKLTHQRGKSGHGPNAVSCEGVFDKFKDVENFIIKNSIVEAKNSCFQDNLYNYNRGRSGNIMLPKVRDRTLYKNENVYLLVDVSGSVPQGVVGKMTQTLKSMSRRMGPQSKVIYWDTGLVKSSKLRELSGELPCGGGTDLAPAIKFIREKIARRDPNGVLFIISDFEDNNEAMAKEAAKFNHVFGVKWTDKSNWGNISREELDKNYKNMKYCEFNIER